MTSVLDFIESVIAGVSLTDSNQPDLITGSGRAVFMDYETGERLSAQEVEDHTRPAILALELGHTATI